VFINSARLIADRSPLGPPPPSAAGPTGLPQRRVAMWCVRGYPLGPLGCPRRLSLVTAAPLESEPSSGLPQRVVPHPWARCSAPESPLGCPRRPRRASNTRLTFWGVLGSSQQDNGACFHVRRFRFLSLYIYSANSLNVVHL
jgi:hypothetical protein